MAYNVWSKKAADFTGLQFERSYQIEVKINLILWQEKVLHWRQKEISVLVNNFWSDANEQGSEVAWKDNDHLNGNILNISSYLTDCENRGGKKPNL